MFRWFWGLTCDFWAEIEEKIFAGMLLGSISAPVQLSPCLKSLSEIPPSELALV
jgi:hypothetical protein